MWLRNFVVRSVRDYRRERLRRHPIFKDLKCPVDPLILNEKSAVCFERQFIYYRIPKAANTTVISNIYPSEVLAKYSMSSNMAEFKSSLPKLSDIPSKDVDSVLNKFYQFSVVRNPVSRFRSCYLDKVNNDLRKSRSIKKSLGMNESETIDVDNFLYFLESGGLYENAHWAPQSDLISVDADKLDFLGTVENLHADLPIICRDLGIEVKEIKDWTGNATVRKGKKMPLTDAQLNRIYRLYECDFECFKYKKIDVY